MIGFDRAYKRRGQDGGAEGRDPPSGVFEESFGVIVREGWGESG